MTTFLPGEVQSVPDACNTVPSATLSQYLPGTTKQAAPPLNSGTNTECTWTLDNAPTYRVLEVQIEAYTPSALVANPNGNGLVPAGNGSATYAAEAAFASSEYTLETPAANSGQPKATIINLSGMPGGNDTSAFSATQVFEQERPDRRRDRLRPLPERHRHRGGAGPQPDHRREEVRAGVDERSHRRGDRRSPAK